MVVAAVAGSNQQTLCVRKEEENPLDGWVDPLGQIRIRSNSIQE